MNNKFIKIMLYLGIFSVLILSLTGCDKKEDSKELEEKINAELSYLDIKLITMLNKINGISYENYIVKADKINTESKSGESSNGAQSSGSSEGSGGSSSGSSGSEEGGQENSSSAGNSQKDDKSSVKYSMEGNEILLQARTPDWNTVKAEIEKIYGSWSTIMLDLYKVNINNQDILNFNTDLDNATQNIKNENKIASIQSLAKLYSYISKYANLISKDGKMNAKYSTKSSILNAYSAIEQDNYNLVRAELANAEQSFMTIINNINSNTNNQSSINKSYILIKELQNVNQNMDKDIFYIKYKNLMQELNNIK